MKRTFFFITAFCAIIATSSVYAQSTENTNELFTVRCTNALLCIDSSQQHTISPIACSKKKNTLIARDCKAEQLARWGAWLPELSLQIPLLLYMLSFFIAFKNLSPKYTFVKGSIFGALTSFLILFLDAQFVHIIPYSHILLECLQFPVLGLLSFSPSVFSLLPFEVLFTACCVILYGGCIGIYSSNHPDNKKWTYIYIIFALILSLLDLMIV